MLVEPWMMNPRTLRPTSRRSIISERGSCTDTELDKVGTQIRH